MPQAKKAHREMRPRLDAVIRHIKAGSYDDDMSQLQGAIADRQRKRQEAVLGMVKEVFGEEYIVEPALKSTPSLRPRPGGALTQADLEEAQRRAEADEAALAQEAGAVPDVLGSDDEAGIESRSPMIGSIDVAQQAAQEAQDAAPDS